MELIDRVALIKSVQKKQIVIGSDCHPYEAVRIQGQAFRRAVDEAPTIDAVPIIRCKDCKWRHTKGCIYENVNAIAREDDDFCSDGERRSDDA